MLKGLGINLILRPPPTFSLRTRRLPFWPARCSVPNPVDYRTRGADDLMRPTELVATGLAAADLAAHEWLGLLTYRATGLTGELFPAP